MHLFKVFLIISTVKVAFCFPDFRKRYVLSRASRSQIIHSLESMVENPSPNENGVIHSLENMVDNNAAQSPPSSENTSNINQFKLGSFSLQSGESNKTYQKTDGYPQVGYSNETNSSLSGTVPQSGQSSDPVPNQSSFKEKSDAGNYYLNKEIVPQERNNLTEVIKTSATPAQNDKPLVQSSLVQSPPVQSPISSSSSSPNEDISSLSGSEENEKASTKGAQESNDESFDLMESNSGSGSGMVSTIKGVEAENNDDESSGDESSAVEDSEATGNEEYSTISKMPGNQPESAPNSYPAPSISPNKENYDNRSEEARVSTAQSSDNTVEKYVTGSKEDWTLNSGAKSVQPGHENYDVNAGSQNVPEQKNSENTTQYSTDQYNSMSHSTESALDTNASSISTVQGSLARNENTNANSEPVVNKQGTVDENVNSYESGDSSASGTDEEFVGNGDQSYSNLNTLKKMPGHFIRTDNRAANEPVIPNLPPAQISSVVEEELSPNVTVVQSESLDDASESESNSDGNNNNSNDNNTYINTYGSNNNNTNINTYGSNNNNPNINTYGSNNNNTNINTYGSNSNNPNINTYGSNNNTYSNNNNNSDGSKNNDADNNKDNNSNNSNNINTYGNNNNTYDNNNSNSNSNTNSIYTYGNINTYDNNNINIDGSKINDNNNNNTTTTLPNSGNNINTYYNNNNTYDSNNVNNSDGSKNNVGDNNKANSNNSDSNINTNDNTNNNINNNVNNENGNNNENNKFSNNIDESNANDEIISDVSSDENNSYDNDDESGDKGSTEDSNPITSNKNNQNISGDGISSSNSINMNNSYNNNNNNNNSSNSNNSNNDSNNSNNDSNNNDNNNNTDNDSLNNDRTNAEENSTYPNIEEELRQLKIRIDFSALKNNMESIINNSIASANSLDLKQSPNSQTSLTGSITLTNESHAISSDETPLPLEDINTNITDSSNSNESDEAIEQEKKLIALASLTEENTTTTNQDASQINQTKPGKEVKTDYDLENEKKLIAASVENSQNKDEESAKNLKKVENSAELHIHAKASFHTTYFERKGEKVVKQYDDDKLSTLLDDLKFGKRPAIVNRSMDFVNLKQCGLFVEDYNVTKIGESWNRGILSQYHYLYELPKHFSKCSTSAWFNNTDMRGSVFLSFQVKSILGNTMMNNARVCAKYCCREPRCKAWTLRVQEGETRNCDKGSYCCWLKSAVPEVQTGAENSTSGIVDRVKTRDPPTGMRSAVPLGGITTGSFELHADGTFHEWTIENQSPGGSAKLNKGALDMALLGVHVSSKHSSQSALLRTFPPQGYPGVETLSYSGAYPVSKLTPGGKITNRVNMDLYAYPSFQPRNPYKSAVPAVAFTLNVENKDQYKPVNVSFMLNLPLGSQEDTIRVGDNYGEAVYTRNILPSECAKACAKMPKCMAWTTNGPTACLLKDKMPLHAWQSGIISGLKGIWSKNGNMLTMARPGFFPQSGSMTLHALGGEGETTSFAVADDFKDIWRRYASSGMVGNTTNVTSTGIHGSASIHTLLKPGQKKSLTIIMSWYYPNRDHAKLNIGNFYTNLFTSSQDVAEHMRENILETVENILNWQEPFLLPSSFPQGTQPMNKLPLWLNDMLMNSVSYWRSSFWTRDGRWRQWEAYDCNDIDTIHNDMQRILPYMVFYPEVVRHLLLTWAANQLSNGMIEETLSEGCLGSTGKLDNAGGRVMADSTSMFVVGAYYYYKWTGNTDVLNKLWPSCKKAITWLIVDSTKGTGLPFRKTTFYSLSGIDKYDHHLYDSMVYLLALRASRDLAIRVHDFAFERTISAALDRGQSLVEIEFWNRHNNHYRAWWDMEYGAGDWLMSDSFYGQVWAYTLGLGDLVPREKLRHHLEMEVEINGSPWGLRVIDDKRPAMTEEDTSLILSYKYPGCESLENVSKHKSIWMGADANWATLMIHLETDPNKALNQAKKPLDHWRSYLNDQWNIHGEISSGGYGQDGLPWANSHSNAHLVMWHIPLAVSGQQYSAPDLSLTFWPMMQIPFQLPFFIPTATGLIEGKMVGENDFFPEEMFTFRVTSGEVKLKELKIFGAPYGRGLVHLKAGSVVSWSKPRANVKNILSELKNRRK